MGANRIDAIGRDDGRLAAATGHVLDAELDDELQDIVKQAAAEMDAPIALVSLVLERIQFFRAHEGLPEDLAVARATDRDASFCQFVVRDGEAFEVNHAETDDRIPRDLVDRYGIRSYLGVPVSVGDNVLGSLCVIDVENRAFTADQQSSLARLADRVSKRLDALAAPEPPAAPLAPAFAELRNLLVPLQMNVASAKRAAAELAPFARLRAAYPGTDVPANGALTGAGDALDALDASLGDLDQASVRLCENLIALEHAVLEGTAAPTLSEVLDTACQVAFHSTKLVGDVAVSPIPPDLRVAFGRPAAVAFVAAALAKTSDRTAPHADGPAIRISLSGAHDEARVNIDGRLSEHDARAVADRVNALRDSTSAVAIRLREGGLTIAFPRHVDR